MTAPAYVSVLVPRVGAVMIAARLLGLHWARLTRAAGRAQGPGR
jgi:hypothetical protein